MAVFGYESEKRSSWSLLTAKKGDFSRIPSDELEKFGQPKFVREVDLGKPRPAGISAEDLQRVERDGYAFVQVAVGFEEH